MKIPETAKTMAIKPIMMAGHLCNFLNILTLLFTL